MKFTILLKNEDDSTEPMTVSQIERKGPLTAATFGLTLAESKQVLAKVQQEFVEAQLQSHAQAQRICPQCRREPNAERSGGIAERTFPSDIPRDQQAAGIRGVLCG